ncbi:MAG: PAC2 family protein [Dehalococcoidales bacterium]|nr:PAC2 family protein [Dehalococcoidales bacterium]
MNEDIVWRERPNLAKPNLLLAFSGWGNAGQVSSAVAWYLIGRLKANVFAEIKPDEFYVYQSAGNDRKRPLVNIENGLIQTVNIVTTNFSCYHNLLGEHDLIIASGPEPEQKWVRYIDTFLDFARSYQVARIVTIGGSFDAIPHTVPVRITGVVNQANLTDEIKEQGIELINYKGPSSIYTLLMVEAAKRGIPAISLWAHTPHYVQVINFMAAYKLMLKLNRMMGIELDLADAKRDSEFLFSKIEKAIAQKPELQENLKLLEKEYRRGKTRPHKTINQNIVREIEDLLEDSQNHEFGG